MNDAGATTVQSAKLVAMATRKRVAKKPHPIPGLGKRIEDAYLSAGLNRHKAAMKIGVSYSTLNDWEHERVVPDLNGIMPLAELTGVRTDWLLKGEGPKFVDDVLNAEHDTDERERRARYRKAVDEYLASPLASGVSPKIASLLRSFDFATLGVQYPEVKHVHRVRDLMDLQEQLGHFAQDGGQESR